MKRLYVKDEKGERRAVITFPPVPPIPYRVLRRLLRLHPMHGLKNLRVK